MFNLDRIFNKNKDPKCTLSSELKIILGFSPKNISIFKIAFTHKSKNIRDKDGLNINYERLEFLGDSILGTIISDHLYINFPNSQEGDLTKLRSKIVNRESLNKIGYSLGLHRFIDSNHFIKDSKDDIHGNMLESLIGAIYLDRGFEKCKNFILNKIIDYYINFDTIDSSIISYKGTLIEWSQKNKTKLIFKTTKDEGLNPKINFSSILFLDNKQVSKAGGVSKKKSEEKASKRAYNALKYKFRSNE